MSQAEIALFLSFLYQSGNYLEFGSGGSTWLAAQHVKGSVIAIDSSQEWLDKVRGECARSGFNAPKLIYVDIGPVGQLGYPTDPTTKHRWPSYYQSVWNDPMSATADLFLIDGRFRVSCFLETLLHCRQDAVIVFHDYASRPYYHVIERVARRIAATEDIAMFIPLSSKRDEVQSLLKEYGEDTR